jgi:hypothetical protein
LRSASITASECRNVFVGNGSDEVLAHVFLGLLKQARPILFPDISYSFYPVYCGLYQVGFETIPLADDFSIQVGGYTKPNGGIIFPNPNAPTGCPVPLTDIERLLQANTDSVVVIDEAYVDFGGESAIPLTARYPNLLVVQTLSKSRSLAGLRVGFAVGHADLIEALERVKNSFNSYPLDRLAIAGAVAAFEDRELFRDDLPGRHRHSRESGRRIESAGLRSAAIKGQLHLRPPSATRCRKVGAGATATQHHRAPLQAAAHRAVPADYGGYRRAVRGAGRGTEGNPQRLMRSSAARAWAVSPSPCASVAAIGPRVCAPACETSIRLDRFWKS